MVEALLVLFRGEIVQKMRGLVDFSQLHEMVYFITEMQGQEGFSKHAHLKISWIHHQINQKDGFLNYSRPSSYGFNSNFSKESSPPSSSGTKISPALLFIIVILSVLFFISGILHLLVRFLTKSPSHSQSNRTNLDDSSDHSNDALQRQLQQLFHLNDSGLDQAFIDLLPLFSYREILGPKQPFDCAVCLCKFSQMDKLRLLPPCSHAFHKNCIDTWLLSNSTCPICRRTLLEFLNDNPVFDFDDFKEEEEEEKNVEIEEGLAKKGVFQVRLGKFRKLNNAEWKEENESGSSKIDGRRCYSMGSYQYVVGDSNLRVALKRDGDGGDSNSDGGSVEGKKICNGAKIDSYSVSKIWLWSKKGKFASSYEDRLENIRSSPKLDLTRMHRTQGT